MLPGFRFVCGNVNYERLDVHILFPLAGMAGLPLGRALAKTGSRRTLEQLDDGAVKEAC